jgi:type II secretory pathway pseudopilin PulG
VSYSSVGDNGVRGDSGFTLVETLLACVVLAVGIGSVTSAALRCTALQRDTEDHQRAHDACRTVLEQVRGDLVEQFHRYRAAPTFPANDLQVRVSFPAALLEQALGQPVPATARFRDLDGDGQVELDAAAADFVSPLPVQVTVTRGTFAMTMSTLVLER